MKVTYLKNWEGREKGHTEDVSASRARALLEANIAEAYTGEKKEKAATPEKNDKAGPNGKR